MKQIIAALLTALLAACASTSGGARSASTHAVSAALEAPDAAARTAALEAVRADPGAFLPPVFAWVSQELFARGDIEEALIWNQFGGMRLSVDLAFAASRGDTGPAQELPLRYGEDSGEELLAHFRGLPRADLEALFAAANERDARAPRRYPPDWALRIPEGVFDRDWRAAPVTWTEEEVAALQPHQAAALAGQPRLIDLLTSGGD